MNDVTAARTVGFVPLYYEQETQEAWTNSFSTRKHFKGRVQYSKSGTSRTSHSLAAEKGGPAEYARLIRLTGKRFVRDSDAKIGACVSGRVHSFHLPSEIRHREELDFHIHAYCVPAELKNAKDCALLGVCRRKRRPKIRTLAG